MTQIEITPRPPDRRAPHNPWPDWPQIMRHSAAHEEGGERLFSLNTLAFEADALGALAAISASRRPRDNGTHGAEDAVRIPCTMAIVAIGFTGPETANFGDRVALTEKQSIACDARFMTGLDGVFVAGDAKRGQSLIVWAMAEGRTVAHHMDSFLMGVSALPAPLA